MMAVSSTCGIKFCGDHLCMNCLRSGSKPYYDPIGRHLKALRECYFELNEQLTHPENLKNVNKTQKMLLGTEKSTSAGIKEKKLPASDPYLISLPSFPYAYPFKSACKSLPKARHKRIEVRFNLPSENQVMNIEKYFIEQVLAQSGFYVTELRDEASTSVQRSKSETRAINCLCHLVHTFLENFSKDMMRQKRSQIFSKSDDLWGPLETTLRQEFEFDGIMCLHEFYYTRIVKKHDILLEQCVNLIQKYDKIRTANQEDCDYKTETPVAETCRQGDNVAEMGRALAERF